MSRDVKWFKTEEERRAEISKDKKREKYVLEPVEKGSDVYKDVNEKEDKAKDEKDGKKDVEDKKSKDV